MSQFLKFKTTYNCKEDLIEAIKRLGFDEIIQGENLSLYGYQGDQRQQKCTIRIPYTHIKDKFGTASNDIGFFFDEETGTYDLWLSEFDKNSGIHGDRFFKTLPYVHGQVKAEKIMQDLEEEGYTEFDVYEEFEKQEQQIQKVYTGSMLIF